MGIKFNDKHQKKNTNCDKYHLLCYIVMTSTQHIPRSVSEQLNSDNKKHELFKERVSIGFLSTPYLKD